MAQRSASVGSNPRTLTKRMPPMTATSGGISGSCSFLERDSKFDGGWPAITSRVGRGGDCSLDFLLFFEELGARESIGATS